LSSEDAGPAGKIVSAVRLVKRGATLGGIFEPPECAWVRHAGNGGGPFPPKVRSPRPWKPGCLSAGFFCPPGHLGAPLARIDAVADERQAAWEADWQKFVDTYGGPNMSAQASQ
jgi:hypothetical protein